MEKAIISYPNTLYEDNVRKETVYCNAHSQEGQVLTLYDNSDGYCNAVAIINIDKVLSVKFA